MPVPDYGAAPLAKTFVLIRGLSLIAMISIVGMTANFVAEVVSTNVSPPREIVGTLTITCIAALYNLISLPFFYAQANIGLLIMAATDFFLLIAFIVISVVLGRPLSFLNCLVIDNGNAAADAQSAAAFSQALAGTSGVQGSVWSLTRWAATTRNNCFETKAVWGMGIALAILYCCSAIILPTLWMKARKAGGGGKWVVYSQPRGPGTSGHLKLAFGE